MNYSPLDDPSFKEYRNKVHARAAKRRRVRTLIILVAVALVSAAIVVLLALAASEAAGKFDLFGRDGRHQEILPPLDDESSEVESFSPGVSPSGESGETPGTPTEPETPDTPTVPDTPDTPTQSAPSDPTGMTHKTTVYIDPGHGFLSPSGISMDLGAGSDSEYTRISAEQGKALYEADLVLQISLKLRDRLLAAGYDVLMSREDYVYVAMPLATRAQNVRISSADVFISIHANFYSGSGTAYGARVFCCDSNRRRDAAACQSYARSVMAAIDEAGASRRTTGLFDGNSLAMCNSTTTTPAILVETCFLTDEIDARNALTEEWQDLMALALFNGITKEFPLQYTFD